MNASDILITAVGWAATQPREVREDGVPYTDFRLAHTARRFDGQQWVDGRTVWFTVKAFRDLARNVAESVHKGHPVVVQGRLRTETWTGPTGERTTNVLEAVAVGHNLSWGTAGFAKRVYRTAEDRAETGLGGLPDPTGAGGPPADLEDPFATQEPSDVDPFATGAEDLLGPEDLPDIEDLLDDDDLPDEDEAVGAAPAVAAR